MRNFVVFFMILSLSIGAQSQKRAMIKGDYVDQAVQRHHANPPLHQDEVSKPAFPVLPKSYLAQEEEQIGTTIYDLQSNSLLGNRIHLFSDGTLGAVWTFGLETPPNFPDRGTGYNYYDGSDWGPMPVTRIESIRTGWPSYAPYGEDGEIVASHDFTNGSITTLHRETKGAGSWIEWTPIAGPDNHDISWPRMTTSGVDHEIVHYVYTTWPVANGGTVYNGMDGALLYSRTSDGGATWDYLNVQLDGTTITNYNSLSADEYTWAEPRGNTIAFVCADAWHDMFVMKSADNGDNWEKIMVWEHPYPFFDWNVTITTDTLWCPDMSADIAIDNTGKVHLVCGISRVAHFEVGTTYQYWPFTDGIAYWNEDMLPFTAPDQHDALDAWDVLIEDVNLIGWTQDINNNGVIDLLPDIMSYRELGISTMPNISVCADNDLIVTFSASTEGYDNGTYNFKHVWVRGFENENDDWLDFYDLNTDLIHIFDECIYPVMAGSANDYFHVIYNADAEPGTALDEDHAYIENKIYYSRMLLSDIGLNTIIGTDENVSSIEMMSGNYPNPFSTNTTFRVTTTSKTSLRLEVYNVTGRKVKEVDRGIADRGVHLIDLSADGLAPGIYLYKVISGKESVNGKMMVE
ncbi:MAG: T9SS type A sorting domain-containing protein [Bacteroidales bacterium]|nr:T9SS type A sorting domain-containing protein [Bacteroidales bacterium]